VNAADYRTAQLALFDRLSAGHTPSTVVPLRSNYVDAAFCLTLVHLLPADLSASIEDELGAQLGAFASKHHWYPRRDYHLTLKNVQMAQPNATFSPDLVQRTAGAVARVCEATPPLTFDILGPVCLSTSIVLRAIGPLAHRDMVRALDRELAAVGVHDDKTYASSEVFIGNITVCRFTEPPAAELIEGVGTLRDRFLATHTVRDACLVRCDEVCSGASRATLQRFTLGGPVRPNGSSA
jgi:hypothetical protein